MHLNWTHQNGVRNYRVDLFGKTIKRQPYKNLVALVILFGAMAVSSVLLLLAFAILSASLDVLVVALSVLLPVLVIAHVILIALGRRGFYHRNDSDGTITVRIGPNRDAFKKLDTTASPEFKG